MFNKQSDDDHISQMGPYIQKISGYSCYRKENSEIYIQSESKERQYDQESGFPQSLKKQSRNPLIFDSITKKNFSKNDNNKKIQKGISNFYPCISNRAIVSKFIKKLQRNSYVLSKKNKKILDEESFQIQTSQAQQFSNTMNPTQDCQSWKIFQPRNQFQQYGIQLVYQQI